MERRDSKKHKDVFSKSIRAGKRTYFFDVKSTRTDDYYLVITESKRKIDCNGKFDYTKHKLFLYREDFDKFMGGLQETFNFIKNEKGEDYGVEEYQFAANSERELSNVNEGAQDSDSISTDNYTSDISFDDLEDEDKL